MTNTYIPDELIHMALIEDITHQTIALPLEEMISITSHDSRCILAAVL